MFRSFYDLTCTIVSEEAAGVVEGRGFGREGGGAGCRTRRGEPALPSETVAPDRMPLLYGTPVII